MFKRRQSLIEVVMGWSVTIVLGFVILKDVGRWVGFIKWPSFHDRQLWQGLAVFVIFHFIVVCLASLYRRILPQLSLVFIYLNLLLFFYFLFLVKGLIFPDITDQWWWVMICAALFSLCLVFPKRPVEPAFSHDIPFFGKALAGILFLSALCLWIPQDWDIHRKVFVDEGSFWVVAGIEMINKGIITAHTLSYVGAGLHPFGIPLMASMPMTCSGLKDPWGIYCWPLVIIFLLCSWIFAQRWGRWALLFFMSSLLVVFSNEFWPAQLMYQLVYGESVSVVLMLVLLSEIWRCINGSKLSVTTILTISFGIGLLALTKSPLNILIIPLELTFLFLMFRYQRSSIKASVALRSIAASLIPSLLWMVFVKHYHVLVLSTPFHPLEIWGRILHPNTAFLLLALKSMWGLDQNMVYVLGLSILILGVTRNPIWKIMIPAFLWIASWFFYYAYIYCYPDGRGDYLSGLRYLMPVTLVMYWAAAVAYQESIDHLLMKTASWVWMVQLLPIIFVVMLIFFRKIYMFG